MLQGLLIVVFGWAVADKTPRGDAMFLADGIQVLDGFRRRGDDALRQAGHAQRGRLARLAMSG